MRRHIPLLLLVALIAGACQVRVDTAISVDADESGTFAIEMGFDDELRRLAEQGGGELDPTPDEELPPGWSVGEFVDGEFEGVRISTEFENLAVLQAKLRELSELSTEEGGAPDELIDDLSLTRNGDVFDFRADLARLDEAFAGAAGDGDGLEGLDMSQLLENFFQVRFVVTLPGTIESHNADLVEGNTLTWNVRLDGEARTLQATSSTKGGLAALLPIAAAVLLVLGIGAAGLVLYRRRADAGLPEPALVPQVAAPEIQPPAEGDPFSD